MFLVSTYLIIITTVSVYLIMADGSEKKQKVKKAQLIDQINDLLPQTQCGECSFDGCRPYATAITENKAGINQCPPGGMYTLQELSRLTGKPVKPLIKEIPARLVAVIEEEHCIGCVKCITACPVDAIIGAEKQMHSIIPQYCTGCKLCVTPCPVDCIIMKPV